MENRSLNLLDEALSLEQRMEPWPLRGKLLLIEDCVETSGSFVLHHLVKRILSPNSSNIVIFLAFSRPFSHYDRILRKLVPSLSFLYYMRACLCDFFGWVNFFMGMEDQEMKLEDVCFLLFYLVIRSERLDVFNSDLLLGKWL